jgi:hypothetical protein
MRLHSGSIRQWNTWHGRKHGETPHPLGARNFATAARCLGNQIIGVEVRERSISLKYTIIVMMRIQSSRMMTVTRAQRLVIGTLLQRIVMMTLAQGLVMLARLRRMMTLV